MHLMLTLQFARTGEDNVQKKKKDNKKKLFKNKYTKNAILNVQ